MLKNILVILTAISFYNVANAGDCVMKVKRDACAGKEVEALKPYGGKVETEEKKPAASADECAKTAEKTSKIIRKGTLSGKTVTAMFDGKDIGKSFSDKAECK